MTKCPICHTEQVKVHSLTGDKKNFDCFRCGIFEITGTAAANIKQFDPNERSSLSCFVANQNLSGIKVYLDSDTVEREKKYKLTVDEKITKLTQAIYKAYGLAHFSISELQPPHSLQEKRQSFLAIIGQSLEDQDSKEMNWIVGEMQRIGQLIQPNHQQPKWRLSLEAVRSVDKGGPSSNTCFVAMPFSPEFEAVREAIREAVKAAGYEFQILDERQHNGSIPDLMLLMIKAARFVIADITLIAHETRGDVKKYHPNANVMWEAGYAAGLGKEVILVLQQLQSGQSLPFDLNHVNQIRYNPGDLKKFQDSLRDRIKSTVGIGLKA